MAMFLISILEHSRQPHYYFTITGVVLLANNYGMLRTEKIHVSEKIQFANSWIKIWINKPLPILV